MNPSSSNLDYASFGRRSLAFFLDGLVLFIPCVIVGHSIPIMGSLIVVLLYAPILEASSVQATLGKYWVGIQVSDLSGQPITLRTAMVRNLIKLLSAAFLFIGHLFALFTLRKQAFHDMIADTVVIYGRKENDSVADAWVNGVKRLFKS